MLHNYNYVNRSKTEQTTLYSPSIFLLGGLSEARAASLLKLSNLYKHKHLRVRTRAGTRILNNKRKKIVIQALAKLCHSAMHASYLLFVEVRFLLDGQLLQCVMRLRSKHSRVTTRAHASERCYQNKNERRKKQQYVPVRVSSFYSLSTLIIII